MKKNPLLRYKNLLIIVIVINKMYIVIYIILIQLDQYISKNVKISYYDDLI